MERYVKINARTYGDGHCVIYVMGRDQRVHDNHALLQAQKTAIEHKLPLAVVFCLLPKTGYRAREHYQWMLAGLRQVESDLNSFNIPFMLLLGDPLERLNALFHHTEPAAVYFDMSPLRGPQKLHQTIAKHAKFPVYEVDTHNVVPVWAASNKQEYAARTLRPKIHRLLPDFLNEPSSVVSHPVLWPGVVQSMQKLQSHIDEMLASLPSNHQQLTLQSGEQAAHELLTNFIAKRLHGYAKNRNDPSKDGLSGLSPYLHFGQISSLRVMLEVTAVANTNPSLQEDADALLEEMVIRKELSDNFCLFNSEYASLLGAPEWARMTLQKHVNDHREFLYTIQQLENAQTHDPAWNAAQNQLRKTGKMHGYMRMYWAKKVLEWTKSPKEAIRNLIYLNDFYSLDGGDPNGYVGILWAIAGLHDRPWSERPIFGTVRYMNESGLRRKFDVEQYIRQNA